MRSRAILLADILLADVIYVLRNGTLRIFQRLSLDCNGYVRYYVPMKLSYREVAHSMTLGEKILLLRKQNNMTQEQLAERLAITRQTVSKWELGESEPDITYLIQLSEIFQVTTDYLIKDAPNTPPKSDFPSEKEPTQQGKAKMWIGGIFTIIGVFGVLTFWVLSIVRPAEYGIGIAGGEPTIYTGLQGFLRTWNAAGLFWFVVVIGAIGAILLFFPNFGKGSAIDAAEKELARVKDEKQRVEHFLKDLEQHKK
jgi:transcriptional regulator with XRE-family HTH domain